MTIDDEEELNASDPDARACCECGKRMHVDGGGICDICGEFVCDDCRERQSCDNHYTCPDCGGDLCPACKEADEESADVLDVIRRA